MLRSNIAIQSFLFNILDLVGVIVQFVGSDTKFIFSLINKCCRNIVRQIYGTNCISQSRYFCSSQTMIEWAVNCGCSFGIERGNVCGYVAANGDINLLEDLCSDASVQYSLNERTCKWAAENGQLVMLQWLRSKSRPCPWDKDIAMHAAKNGADLIG